MTSTKPTFVEITISGAAEHRELVPDIPSDAFILLWSTSTGKVWTSRCCSCCSGNLFYVIPDFSSGKQLMNAQPS